MPKVDTDKEDEGGRGDRLGHDKRYAGGVEKLRSPERLERLEVARVVDLCLEGATCKTVLDVGTGSGVFAEQFVTRGLGTTGCDVNADLLATAARLVPDAEFSAGEMGDLPYHDGSFDLVFLGCVLHEADDMPQALAEARRVARVRAAVLEWPYCEEQQGPPLAHRLRPEAVETAARTAGFAHAERLELRHMVLFRLAVELE